MACCCFKFPSETVVCILKVRSQLGRCNLKLSAKVGVRIFKFCAKVARRYFQLAAKVGICIFELCPQVRRCHLKFSAQAVCGILKFRAQVGFRHVKLRPEIPVLGEHLIVQVLHVADASTATAVLPAADPCHRLALLFSARVQAGRRCAALPSKGHAVYGAGVLLPVPFHRHDVPGFQRPVRKRLRVQRVIGRHTPQPVIDRRKRCPRNLRHLTSPPPAADCPVSDTLPLRFRSSGRCRSSCPGYTASIPASFHTTRD